MSFRISHFFVFFFSSRRRHTRFDCDWSSDVCSSDLLRDCFARVPLLAFATLSPTTHVSQLIASGISGIVSKAEPLAMLSDAIVRVSQGLSRLPPDCTLPAAFDELSRNEREVLDLLLAGLTVSEIALQRHRSVKTISTQKTAALRKLGLRNDADRKSVV